jgi:heme O synthase-like polyprenyltransferase
MALEPGIAVLEVVPVARQHRTARPHARVSDYWALTKPEINFLIAIATFAGFYLGLPAELHALPVHAAD